MSGTGPVTLGDVLDEERFALRLLTGGGKARARPVTGAHSVELERPSRWLDRGWIMLSAGMQLTADREQQRALVAELDEAGVAALGFGLEAVHATVPPGVLEEAEERGFPVFAVPLATAFRDIVSFVHRNLLSEEIRAFGRMTAMQRFLMDAIGTENPRVTAVRRLASLTEARVGLLLPSGEFEIATGALPGDRIIEEIRSRQAMTVTFAAGGVHGHAFPIGAPERGDGEVPWLVIAVPEARSLHPLAKAVGSATVPLLAAMSRLDQAQRMQDNAARRATLEALMEAAGREEARILAAQALVWGVDIGAGAVALAIEDAAPRSGTEPLLATLSAEFARHQLPFLATARGSVVALLVPAAAVDRVLAVEVMADRALHVGIGRSVTDPLAVGQSFTDAQLATRPSVRASRGRVVRYDELDLGTVLVNEVPMERLAPKIDAWLQPLRENRLVHQTLVTYFENDLDVVRTASVLHLHPNSVRYRLSRAEDLIGASLRSSTTIVALHIALMGADGQARPDSAA